MGFLLFIWAVKWPVSVKESNNTSIPKLHILAIVFLITILAFA